MKKIQEIKRERGKTEVHTFSCDGNVPDLKGPEKSSDQVRIRRVKLEISLSIARFHRFFFCLDRMLVTRSKQEAVLLL